jgi:hypothetical protein
MNAGKRGEGKEEKVILASFAETRREGRGKEGLKFQKCIRVHPLN